MSSNPQPDPTDDAELESAVDQAPITGESVPVDKAAGDLVYAATINRSGYLEVQTTKPFAENTLARIDTVPQKAVLSPQPVQHHTEKSRTFTRCEAELRISDCGLRITPEVTC